MNNNPVVSCVVSVKVDVIVRIGRFQRASISYLDRTVLMIHNNDNKRNKEFFRTQRGFAQESISELRKSVDAID